MRTKTKFLMRALGLAALLACGLTQASVVTYTSHSSFLAAAAAAGLGTSHLSNFDSTAVGTSYADGAGPTGAGFTMTSTTYLPVGQLLPDVPTVQSQFWTTSGRHYLGLDNSSTQFSNGDTLSFAVSGSVRAFGLYIIGSTNDILAGDLTVLAGGSSLSNSTADATDGLGSSAYYFGFVSNADITSVVLDFGTPGASNFFFNAAVDDVILFDKAGTTPPTDPGIVPEPSSLALLGLAGLALTAVRRRGISASAKPLELQP